MFIFLIRTTILYALVVIVMRLMGKRQVGELEPFELVIAIMISDLASLPMQDARLPLINGVIPILTLLILQVTLSEFQMKNRKARKILDGSSSVLVKDGIVDMKQLRKQRLSLNELLEELRIQGEIDLSQLAYVIWETNGSLSIIRKNQIDNRPVYIPKVLFQNGKVFEDTLKIFNKDKAWLFNEVKNKNINIDNIEFIIYGHNGELYIQEKGED